MMKYPFSLTNKEKIAQELRHSIFFGELHSGQELIQDTLAKELGVSRMPVRDALSTLQSEGLVEHIPNRGYFVRNLSRDFFKDYYDIRIMFEYQACCGVCDTQEDLSVLQRIKDEEKDRYMAGDISALSQLNDELYEFIGANCGSPRLAAYLRHMRSLTPRQISTPSEERSNFIYESFTYHQNLVDAIEARDKEQCARLVAAQLGRAKEHYFAIRNALHLDEKE